MTWQVRINGIGSTARMVAVFQAAIDLLEDERDDEVTSAEWVDHGYHVDGIRPGEASVPRGRAGLVSAFSYRRHPGGGNARQSAYMELMKDWPKTASHAEIRKALHKHYPPYKQQAGATFGDDEGPR